MIEEIEGDDTDDSVSNVVDKKITKETQNEVILKRKLNIIYDVENNLKLNSNFYLRFCLPIPQNSKMNPTFRFLNKKAADISFFSGNF